MSDGPDPAGEPSFRSGFACFVGRPNAGKSTLTNALVGTKVAITSGRPQTTRHAIRGIVHREDAQLVLVDTPGLHRPRTLLGQRLNDVVRATLSEVDVVGFCAPADEPVGRGDQFIAQELSRLPKRTPVIAILTKADKVADPDRLGARLLELASLGDFAEIVPVSAVGPARAQGSPGIHASGSPGERSPGGSAAYQLDVLADLLVARLPAGPPLYPDGELTDEPELVMVAELVREAALEGVRDELPHSLAVVVEEMLPREDRPADRPLLDVHVNVFVERPSQKAIVIGAGGSRLKDVGTRARGQIEALLGTPVFLDLRVKVAKDWQRDPKQLRRLGF
ncbi:GTPase Era [Frankia sp. CNm7]|uniref:GTPase Era n=1 Tax=Frankia nepalensis TaxID=1836974 RepID=A0A937URX9_9ACTN|nr:GTPase Era [Frankia nepalensis]MBL7500144.1 GTPase Era [Frankia nepalensis]MBL7511176.1 GTPase Era [Frankia nepalensis]MBL7522172.1 GTPase Era [Frankia nepalensis]MBL7631588.1 GTPase Era [Frankia nepalensis]